MKINPLATLSGIVMIVSIFLPWVTSDSWWFQCDGSLIDLTEKGLRDMSSYNNIDDLMKKDLYQLIGIVICLLYLVIGGLLSLSQVRWLAHAAAVLGILGLFIYTVLTLDFLRTIPYDAIGFGYYIGWVGAILTGIGAESQ